MSESFSSATFDSGNWSTGLIAVGSYTGTSILGLANIASVTFTGTLNTPGALSGATMQLNLANGTNSGLAVTGLNYVGFAPATDGSGDPTYFISANVAGILTPVTFAITTDPAGPLNFTSILTGVNETAITAPTSTNPLPPAPCFATGTLILTTRGDVAVEHLEVGDLAVTASGNQRPIVWIGHRRIERPAHDAWPVRVNAGAFGESQPARDLFLSPGHAVCVDVMGEMFIPVEQLVNGATIARVEVPEVTYWHVELESHDVLLAEGLPAESYMDTGNRAWFGREYGRLQVVDPERVAESLSRYARPFVNDGPIVAAVKARLADRAEALGWRRDADLDLHLLVDGTRVEPMVEGDKARFAFDAAAGDVRLVSGVFIPSADGLSEDGRELGFQLHGLAVGDQVVSLDDPALDGALHDLECHDETIWRWTRGETRLPTALWSGRDGAVALTVAFLATEYGRWQAPAAKPRRLRTAA